MNKGLLFGGTGEGRALAEWMAARGIPHTVCVATLRNQHRPMWAGWTAGKWRRS